MINPIEMTQEEYEEYEKRREEKRRKIIEELDGEISRDERTLADKLNKLRNVDTAPEAEKKEIDGIKRRISSNKEIRTIIGDNGKDAFRHGDFIDKVLDHPRILPAPSFPNAPPLPLGGIGILALLEIRELFYKWKDDGKK
jgi:hypothetical protein